MEKMRMKEVKISVNSFQSQNFLCVILFYKNHIYLSQHYEFFDKVGGANRATVATVDKQCGHTKSKETEKISSSCFYFQSVNK